MPLPTHLQRYCDPASLDHSFSLLSLFTEFHKLTMQLLVASSKSAHANLHLSEVGLERRQLFTIYSLHPSENGWAGANISGRSKHTNIRVQGKRPDATDQRVVA